MIIADGRLSFMLRCIVTALFLVPAAGQAQPNNGKPAFVLVHGAWGSGDGWSKIKALLERRGYQVHAPSLTGQGEKAAGGGPGINLDSHISDIAGLIERKHLRRVILVGHSYGGMVVAGVAERLPERIARVVYVDAFLPENGESAFDQMNPAFAESLRRRAIATGDGWAIATAGGKGAPQPLGTLEQKLRLENAAAAHIPGTYILTIAPGANVDAFSFAAGRAQKRTWPVHVMRTGHLPQITMAAELAELLDQAALATTPVAGDERN